MLSSEQQSYPADKNRDEYSGTDVCMYVCAIVKVTRTYFEMWVVLGIPVWVRGNAIGQVLSWGEWVKPFPVVLCVYVCTCE